jgi:hypothetical protein
MTLFQSSYFSRVTRMASVKYAYHQYRHFYRIMMFYDRYYYRYSGTDFASFLSLLVRDSAFLLLPLVWVVLQLRLS